MNEHFTPEFPMEEPQYPYWPEINIARKWHAVPLLSGGRTRQVQEYSEVTLRTSVRILSDGTWYRVLCKNNKRYDLGHTLADHLLDFTREVYDAQVFTDIKFLKSIPGYHEDRCQLSEQDRLRLVQTETMMNKEVPLGRNTLLRDRQREGETSARISDSMQPFFDIWRALDDMKYRDNFMNFNVRGNFITIYMRVDAGLHYINLLNSQGYTSKELAFWAVDRGYPGGDYYCKIGPYDVRIAKYGEKGGKK